MVLTGPIGAGKSEVAALLRDHGAVVIEADALGHAVLAGDGEAFDAVAGRWPKVVVDTGEGPTIDRIRLAAIVFADAAELSALEAITHPPIVSRVEGLVDAAEPDVVVVVEMPLLVPPLPWHRLVVLAPTPERHRRAVARGMTPEDVTRRMAAQPGDREWRRSADSTVENDGDLRHLAEAVDRWWSTWISPPLMEETGGTGAGLQAQQG